MAVTRKEDKYTVLSINYHLIAIALETLVLLDTKTSTFFRELGCRLASITEDSRETTFLFLR